ncbi:hypothetical protein Acr_00g0098430 [Actinidia rufa]|uniref:C2 NT-type domain-containing protein n=1 Tax=Actinidia rufa TaxID=165716 RepID=A0A7J0DZG9_9ERIC|nr:hypothetical protein Acr_00g0098430 [Actinidia rufa]
MFRSHRQNRTSKSGEKIDFKFSNFQAIQVPKGWDKLFVSVISVETGKTITKLSKAPVRNGNCQWAETLSESIWISQDDSIKALEECLFKFVVSMVRIHCLTPRATLRDEEPKDSSPHVEEQNADHYEMESKSNGSDDSFARNDGSPKSKDLGSPSHPGELQSRETSFSASGSHHSFDSAEGPIGRGTFSPRNDLDGEKYNLEGRQDSISSLNSSPHSNYPAENPSRSNQSSFNSRLTDTIEELRAEAKMWERNARKLMLDLEILRNESSDRSKKQADLDMELSAACTERDSLKKEVEQLKLMFEELMLKQTAREDSTFQSEGAIHIRKELESEIKFQQESNASLALQLKRSQESNIELVTVLQELEETIEKQKGVYYSSCNSCKNSEKKWQVDLQLLEQALEDKRNDTEKDCSHNDQTLMEIETEYKCKLSSKEKEIASLEVKLSEALINGQTDELVSTYGGKVDLIREIEALKEKLQELESDCSELTNENLELVLKLKDSKNSCTSFDGSSSALPDESFCHTTTVDEWADSILDWIVWLNNLLEARIVQCEEVFKQGELEIQERNDDFAESQKKLEEYVLKENKLSCSIRELENLNIDLEANLTGLEKELDEKRSAIEKFETDLFLKEEEIGCLRQCQGELEARISGLEKEKFQLKENMEILLRESTITSKCLDDLRNELTVLSSSADSHISANKILERNCSELESLKHELELHLLDMEKENTELSDHISHLEAQLKHMMEKLKLDLEQKLQDMQNQMSEAQEECENLQLANQKLQESAKSLVDECSTLQKENGLLRKQKLELEEHCTHLETELGESQKISSDYSKRAEALEANLSEILEAFCLKEKSMTSEIDALLQENRNQKEKFVLVQSKVKLTESDLDTVRTESELKVQGLLVELSVFRQNHELVAADHEKTLKKLRSYRKIEDKLKTGLNDLELKLTVSEYERQQLIDETANLKVQLLKVTCLQDEILALKNELNASKFEKEKLEASLQSVSGDCEELMAEKTAFLQKISSLETAISEFKECKREKVALEEKLLQVESDMSARETLCSQDTELKNELSRITKEQKKVRSHSRSKKGDKYDFHDESPRASGVDHIEKVKLLENELALALEANNKYKIQLQRLSSEGRNNHSATLRKTTAEGEVVAKERYERTKSSLEAELRDLRERYSQMSLRYAEVEAEREDLVMHLKASKNGKKWFS